MNHESFTQLMLKLSILSDKSVKFCRNLSCIKLITLFHSKYTKSSARRLLSTSIIY